MSLQQLLTPQLLNSPRTQNALRSVQRQLRTLTNSLLLWTVLISLAAAQSPDPAILQQTIEQARIDWNVPGMSVAVVKDGHVVLSQGFGVRESGGAEPVDGDTVFAIASNTKAFTAAAIAMLQDEGRLHWDDRVQQHLPWLQLYDPWVSAEIRIDDLLCHRSGLGTFSGDLLWWGTPYSPEEVLRRARFLPARNRFRSEYGYSNLMFLAAGEVIRVSSGQTWSEFIQQRILNPLQMHRTVTSISALKDHGNVATPHKTTQQDNLPIPWFNWDTMAAAGGLISSSSDMARWLQVQLDRGRLDGDRQLYSAAAANRMWTPHTVIPVSDEARSQNPTTHFRSCGLGWMLADYKGRMTVGHGGGYDGMYSQVLLIPEERLGIVVLTNSMTGIAAALTKTIADQYLGGDSTDWLSRGLEQDRAGRQAFQDRITAATTPKATGTQPSRPLEACTGNFLCPLYGQATVSLENGGLVLKLQPYPELVADLHHLHYDTWRIQWRKTFAWFGEGTIQFVPDADGTFQELRLDVPNDDLWFDELKLRRHSN